MSDLIPVYTTSKRDSLDSNNNTQAVNRLSEDVLAQVFMIARVCPLGSELPLCTFILRRVSHVCSYWRRTCINNPLLWDCIHITSLPLRLSRFTNECISRAQGVPVSLTIITSNAHKFTLSTWNHLLKSLIDKGVGVERWKALVLHVSDYRVFPSLLDHLDSHLAPKLEFISCEPQGRHRFIELSQGFHSAIPDPSTSLSPSLPNLSSLKLDRINLRHIFDHRPPLMLISLTRLNLEHVALYDYAPDTFALLLSSSPHLEELSMLDEIVDNYSSGNTWTITTPTITFSFLRRLKCFLTNDPDPDWEGAGLMWAIHFLGSIHTPRLQQLIIITPWTKNVVIEQFVDFISTGHIPDRAVVSKQAPSHKLLYPELRYFAVVSPLLEGAGLYKSELMLASLPSLTHLGICGEDIAVVDRVPQCSPKLTYLSVESPIASDPKLGDVLRRRQDAGFPISVIALQPSRFDALRLHCDDDASGLPSAVELKSHNRNQTFEFLDL
ncbi:unnamed protein product [Rhizoctonia solani]|uniref:F-box domain-containing protein n=1 Tax=Rhizoctonia solani TaxID=456999 RepID=A0A8H3DB06_9AGAM|nr:unnamed protein product [Rhizoctonia solani]CAE6515906.1 unnamed protein product [Rhizoctonia solani]